MLTITSYKFGDLPEAYAVQSEGRDIARFDKLADAELFVEAKKVEEMIGGIGEGNPEELLAKPDGTEARLRKAAKWVFGDAAEFGPFDDFQLVYPVVGDCCRFYVTEAEINAATDGQLIQLLRTKRPFPPEGSVEIDASKLPISAIVGDKIHAPISEILAKRYILPDSYMKELVEDVKPDVVVTKE